MVNLSPLAQKFILHFGEMGSRWGINRTVGQIYSVSRKLGRGADRLKRRAEIRRNPFNISRRLTARFGG